MEIHVFIIVCIPGTFAIICLMVGEVVESNVSPLLPSLNVNGTTTKEYTEEVINLRVQYAVTVSFLVGILQVIAFFVGIEIPKI